MGPRCACAMGARFGRSKAEDLAAPEFWCARRRFSAGENSGDDGLLPDDRPGTSPMSIASVGKETCNVGDW